MINLGAMNDSGEFDLEAGTADKIMQIAEGGAGNDDLIGHAGLRPSTAASGTTLLDGGPGRTRSWWSGGTTL